ncbi:hypothetical protein F3Y22_tig00110266pilonHSYRG00146 [Hibiscus syriacus]|uniref:Wall-associated receptor kinase galacturonan-binding domain-containing protein n=1 Tax=Hibiscus syriacus TaxID=106335 RepID=A0A6A3BAT8_HIBSY|nr:hypothetical protein F3Y22_tig00110266pilonHSYRG00146 [Hibiscus syriacus]
MAFICMLKEVALFAVALTLATASVASQSKPGCQSLCGNISIPYPFGTGESCNISSRHFIRCDTTLNLPRAFLSYPVPGGGYAEIRLLHISLDGYVFVTSSGNIGYYCYNSSGHDSGSSGRLSKGLWSYQFYFNNLGNHSGVLSFNPCNYGFIVEDGAHKFSVSDLNDTNFNQREFPRILDWTIGNQNCTEAQKDPQNYACKAHSACIDPDNNDGYLCKCVDGFRVTLISAVKILRNARLKPCSRGGICHNTLWEIKRERTPCARLRRLMFHPIPSVEFFTQYQIPNIVEFQFTVSRRAADCCHNNIPTVCRHKTRRGLFLAMLKATLRDNVSRITQGLVCREEPNLHSSCPLVAFLREVDIDFSGFDGDDWKNGIGCTQIKPSPDSILILALLVLGPSLVILILIAGVWRLIRKVVSNDGGLDKAKLVSSEELEAATDQYNKNRILGRGGQGCCLETEVPVLVYEFIPNGTLSHFIHDQNEEYPRSWDMRLRIAAAVASFIPSLVCIGPHLSPRYQIKSEEARGLVVYFLSTMEENRLPEIVDAEVMKDGLKDEVVAVAELAKRSLN